MYGATEKIHRLANQRRRACVHTCARARAISDRIRRKRPELRIVLASATLDAEALARYFDPAYGTSDAISSILSIEGRMYPVEVAYTTEPVLDLVQACIDAVWAWHTHEPLSGDMLVFVPGRDDIQRILQALADRMMEAASTHPSSPRLHLLPLYAELDVNAQRAVFLPPPRGTRKVIVATNVAETSVTLDGVRFVVDSGYTKTRLLDTSTGVDVLAVVPTSRASAQQRAGRAGRTAPGKCLRLYPESELARMRASDAPELVRCDLSTYLLQLKALGIDNVARFDYVPPAPPAAHVARALAYLASLQALDPQGRLCSLGEQLAEAPLSPMMARAVLHAAQEGCADEMLTIAAMTSVGTPFLKIEYGAAMDVHAELARRKFVAEEGDQLTLLNVYEAFIDPRIGRASAAWAAKHALHYATLKRAQAIRAHLVKYATLHWSLPLHRAYDATRLRRCLAAGFFKNAARYMPDGTYRSVQGATLHVHPASVLFSRTPTSTWVVFGDVVWTTQAQMRDIATVEEDWLLSLAYVSMHHDACDSLLTHRKDPIFTRMAPEARTPVVALAMVMAIALLASRWIARTFCHFVDACTDMCCATEALCKKLAQYTEPFRACGVLPGKTASGHRQNVGAFACSNRVDRVERAE